jgi:hypothetical protein
MALNSGELDHPAILNVLALLEQPHGPVEVLIPVTDHSWDHVDF